MVFGANLSRKFQLAFVAFAASTLIACGTPSSYMGISLRPGGAAPVVQALAAKAQGSDKQSQYELGRLFEESTDPDGLKKAIKLYRIAATSRGGARLLYTPGSSGVATSVVSTGMFIQANKAAETRLRELSLSGKDKNSGQVKSGRIIRDITKGKQEDREARFFPDMLPCAAKTPYRHLTKMASYIVEGDIKYQFIDQKKQERYTGAHIYSGYYDIELNVSKIIKWGLLPQKETILIKQYDIWPEHRCPSWVPTSIDSGASRIFVLLSGMDVDGKIEFSIVASYNKRKKL